jgi:hypothetical protein
MWKTLDILFGPKQQTLSEKKCCKGERERYKPREVETKRVLQKLFRAFSC